MLSIFIRTNSGGTVLSYSDLLLSIATSEWQELDARSAIHDLVDELNGIRFGFNFTKDFVLKAGLMLADISSVGFKVENFNRQNMRILERKWSAIADTLRLTTELVGAFGLSRDTIRADSALLPVPDYLHRREAARGYLTSSKDKQDRVVVKRWLIRSLVKPGVWGSGLDVLLTGLREVIRSSAAGTFPAEALEREIEVRGKTLEFTEEEIRELVDTEYGNRNLLGLMILLFPFVDTATNQFHIDHIYPRDGFRARKLQRLGLTSTQIEELQSLKDKMPNLQLLQGQLNQSKSDQMPSDWVSASFTSAKERSDYLERHMMDQIGADIASFPAFFELRRVRLIKELHKVLNG